MKQIEIEIYWLQQTQKILNQVNLSNYNNINVYKVKAIDTTSYKYLYTSVGENYKWCDRLLLSNDNLLEIINSPFTEVLIFDKEGEIFGYTEIHIENKDVEIVYFGLFNKFVHKGLGSLMFDYIISYIWLKQIDKIWLHTCSLDHPKALNFYIKHGFKHYKTTIFNQNIIDNSSITNKQYFFNNNVIETAVKLTI